MSDDTHAPASALASQVPEHKTKSNYPTKFADKFEGREKRPLGDLFGQSPRGGVRSLLPSGGIRTALVWSSA